jgi:tetratricopeptide (TPR) repeat protein
MKSKLLIFACSLISFLSYGQSEEAADSLAMLKSVSKDACLCVDSIQVSNKTLEEISKEISACINKHVTTLQTFDLLMNAFKKTQNPSEMDGQKTINIAVNTNENSDDFKRYYYKIERYMMKNCKALSDKIAANEIVNERSFSENEKALKFYDKGIQASQKEDYKKAVDYFEKAVKEDPQFTFAWDNLGVNYRRLNNFDKAIECYKNSLDIDPFGMMPLQNIAVAYQYKKEYDKAIKAYEKLATIDKNNPEIFYGIGNIYAMNLNDFEKGLDNMCKAYNIYVDQKSPYRADAEKMINMIYGEMKDKGKEDVFNKILEQNHISPDSK